MIEINKIYNEDCLDTMSRMSDGFIDLVVTSPPYDLIRSYKFDNIELAWNFDKFTDVAKELFRVMKDGGVIVWVVGDQVIDGSESGTSFRQALYFKEIGFRLHDTMIYQKSNFSVPSNNRYHQLFEYMFILSKNAPKTFNPIIDNKNKYAGQTSWGRNTIRNKDGELIEHSKKVIKEYGKRGNIWKYNVGKQHTTLDDFAFKHPAMFPEELVKDHIISWSNEGDLVYDPFIGSGTTAKMAKKLNRNYIGSEISKEYYEIALLRVDKESKGVF